MKAITLLVLVLQLVRANFSIETKNGRQNDQESTEDDFQNNLVKRRILVDDDNNGQETSVDDDNKEIDGNRKNKVIKMKNERRLDSSDENNNNSNSNPKQKKKSRWRRPKVFSFGGKKKGKEQSENKSLLTNTEAVNPNSTNSFERISINLTEEEIEQLLNEAEFSEKIRQKLAEVIKNSKITDEKKINDVIKGGLEIHKKIQKLEKEKEEEEKQNNSNSNSKSKGGRMRKRII